MTKMTREEAINFLRNKKVYVGDKSAEIQNKLFDLGFTWSGIGKKVSFLQKPFIYIWNDMELAYGNNMEEFLNNKKEEISVEKLTSIEIVKRLKENDIVVCEWLYSNVETGCRWIAIVKEGYSHSYKAKVVKFLLPAIKIIYNDICNTQEHTRLATQEEINSLIGSLKKENSKEAAIILEEVFKIKKYYFKPFDKVLVKNDNTDTWKARFFDKMNDMFYCCTDALAYEQCIPYEGNEHLHDTTKES